jgi:hypothetical protein
VTDKEIDAILAKAPPPVDPKLIERVTDSIQGSMRPVRPLPADSVLITALVVSCSAVAVAGAAHLGFLGIRRMSVLEIVVIFAALAVFVWLSATELVSEMIPGSRHRVNPAALLGGGALALIAIFGALFRDYQTTEFVRLGLACLGAGLMHAVPVALASWLLLRRGFAVNPTAAGMVAGTLAGLAGLVMLELHCPNFEVLHLVVWHTAVLLVSGGVGAFLARGRSL